VPIVSIWELKAGGHGAPTPGRAGVHTPVHTSKTDGSAGRPLAAGAPAIGESRP
jgi:hypothetical protein